MHEAKILPFREEEKAKNLLNYMSWMAPLVTLLASLADLVLILVYQRCFHPWRRILAEEEFVELVPTYRRTTSAE